MKQLDVILAIRKDMDSIGERLIELRQITQPRIQVISDMPRGGGEPKNIIEEYVIKADKLQKKFERKQERLDSKWQEVIDIFVAAGVTEAQQNMMKERYYYGKPWNACVKGMRLIYPTTKWSDQKLFRMHRDVMCKINKTKREIL